MDSSDIPSGRSPRKELQRPRPKSPRVHKDSHKIKKPTLAPPQPSQPEAHPLPPVLIGTEYLPKIMQTSREKFKCLVQGLTGLPSSSSCSSTSSVAPSSNPFAKYNNSSAMSPAALYATTLPSFSSYSSTSSVAPSSNRPFDKYNKSSAMSPAALYATTLPAFSSYSSTLPSFSSYSSTSSVAPSSKPSDNNNSSAMSPAALYATTLPSVSSFSSTSVAPSSNPSDNNNSSAMSPAALYATTLPSFSSFSSTSSVAPSSNPFDDKNSGLPDSDPLLGIDDWSEIAHLFDMMDSFPGMSSRGPANSLPPSPPSDQT